MAASEFFFDTDDTIEFEPRPDSDFEWVNDDSEYNEWPDVKPTYRTSHWTYVGSTYSSVLYDHGIDTVMVYKRKRVRIYDVLEVDLPF